MADDFGFIRVYRQLKDKAFYKDSEKVHLWLHILIKATHKGREELLGGKPIKCLPGQFTVGRKQLADETGINESKIERILTYFEKIEQQIEQRKTSKNRLISIVNWHLYQYVEQQIEQQVNNDRTTSEQQVNTLQECNNVNNDNKKHIADNTLQEHKELAEKVYSKYSSVMRSGTKKRAIENIIKIIKHKKYTYDDFRKMCNNYYLEVSKSQEDDKENIKQFSKGCDVFFNFKNEVWKQYYEIKEE